MTTNMTTELTTAQKVIVMKSGMAIWVAEDRATRLEDILAGSEGHRFVKLDDKTINSAEIEGIYTPAKYDDLAKIKQGMWQCQFLQWHGRRAECDCKQDILVRRNRAERAIRRLKEDTFFTDPEQKASVERYLEEDRQWLEKRGVMLIK